MDVIDTITTAVDGFLASPNLYIQLLQFFLILLLGVLITRAILMPLVGRLMRKQSDGKKTVHALENIVGVVAIVFTLSIALNASDFGGLATIITTITAALTVAIGFGMRDTIGNWISGLLIQLENPFLKNDYIKIGDNEGVVKDVELSSTRLEAPSGEKLLIPNSQVFTNAVRNKTKDTQTTDHLSITIKPGLYREASDILVSVAEEHKKVFQDPAPTVKTVSFEEEKLVLRLRFAVRDYAKPMHVRTELLKRFMEEATEKGLFDKDEADTPEDTAAT